MEIHIRIVFIWMVNHFHITIPLLLLVVSSKRHWSKAAKMCQILQIIPAVNSGTSLPEGLYLKLDRLESTFPVICVGHGPSLLLVPKNIFVWKTWSLYTDIQRNKLSFITLSERDFFLIRSEWMSYYNFFFKLFLLWFFHVVKYLIAI